MATAYLTDLIYDFIDYKLGQEEKTHITGSEIESRIWNDEEAQREMMEELFDYLMRSVRFETIANELREKYEEEEDSEEEEC